MAFIRINEFILNTPAKPFFSADVTELDRFDDIIDVRTPAEYAQDHIPGAINCPVLTDQERIRVGIAYHRHSTFEGKRIGASLIAKNIARYLETDFAEKPKNWRPLIYCWRGGKRSGAMTYILRQIGWNAHVLEGGYKNYRRHVIAELSTLPQQFKFQVITGATGSAKTSVLTALGKQGAQVLDLENLAKHKGSVLGNLLNQPQPSQKHFESLLLQALQSLDSTRIVYVEAESKKIGQLQVPDSLLEIMRQSPCIKIAATLEARVNFLQRDYDYMIENQEFLKQQLEFLKEIVGKETLYQWYELIDRNAWSELVKELLVKHYDKLYSRSQNQNYQGFMKAKEFNTDDLSSTGIEALASKILHN